MSDIQSDQDFMEELQRDFLGEVSFLLEQSEESYLKLENPDLRVEELGKIFRLAHSLKGTGAAVGFTDLAEFAHQVEDCLTVLRNNPALVSTEVVTLLLRCGDAFRVRIAQLKAKDSAAWSVSGLEAEVQAMLKKLRGTDSGSSAEPEKSVLVDADWEALAASAPKSLDTEVPAATAAAVIPATTPASTVAPSSSAVSAQREVLKIDSERVESVLNLVGELVVLKSQLINRCEGGDQGLNQLVSLMDKTIRELQDKTLSMRVTPLKSLFLKTQRVVRDLSVKLGKPMEFVMEGEDTEIDRAMVDALADPLMHLARNSLDHGIESLEGRGSAGKPEKGMIYLRAYQRGGRILIELSDDGKGLQRERILAKAVERGIVRQDSAQEMSDRQVYSLIFAPGFSTAEQVTDVSGRGVGMDVVKTQVEKLKGKIDLESVPGVGTCVRMSLPMSTSILDGMLVKLGEEPFILPIESIRELVDLDETQILEVINGKAVWRHRDKLYPVMDMQNGFKSGMLGKPKLVAIIDGGGRDVAFLLSAVTGQSQVVLKNLDERIRTCRGVSGAAILGNGRVALVLDPAGIVQAAESAFETQGRSEVHAA
ncbi:MAG: chemotaxis protein CheA [Bdellovibrionales bacterium]|nr:chemotaxis protein CheA [Bdellovibrionales bacterium]